MNIPGKAKIGYKEYKINKVDGPVIDGNKVCYGNIEYDNGIINISQNHSIDQQKCAFIHEVLHGIDDIVEAELSEEQTRLIAKGIYAFLIDNENIFNK